MLPTYWFIDNLMRYIGMSYYVGLSSAAALHGASHQQPQIFQVIISSQIRDIKVKGIKIKFFVKKNIKMNNLILDKKTETGIIKISNPSLTAIDLVKYVNKIGGWNNIATIIAELNEKIDPKQIIEITKNEESLSNIQRIGYLLEFLGDKNKSNIINKFLENKNTNPIPLDSSIPIKNNNLNNKWNIYINRDIEIDEL